MMQSVKITLILLVVALTFFGCEKALIKPDYADDPKSNFQYAWDYIDQHYAQFEIKEEVHGLDWNAIYDQYEPMISSEMTDEELFDVIGEMLNELKDGHSNLSSYFKRSFYEIEFLSQSNFNFDVVERNYLLQDISNPTYNAINGTAWSIIDDSIGYMYFSSFQNSISQFDNILREFDEEEVVGLVLDMRGNGGGSSAARRVLFSYFIDEPTLAGYNIYKTGSGHDEFTEPLPEVIEPGNYFFDKPVTLLTDRGCYSSTSHFAEYMKGLPNVTLIGDTTGGGGGTPVSTYLPNGWSMRCSGDIFLGRTFHNIEEGTDPDIFVNIDPTNINEDAIIERAIQELR